VLVDQARHATYESDRRAKRATTAKANPALRSSGWVNDAP
jgi:hypothetical protein